MIRFILACGAIPDGFMPDSFFARYMAAGASYVPKWLKPDGEIVPMPVSGAVQVGDLLIFEDVPAVGRLIPGIHTQQLGVAFVIREHTFTASEPAINNGKYAINFAQKVEIQGEVDHGVEGHTCDKCKGLGVTY